MEHKDSLSRNEKRRLYRKLNKEKVLRKEREYAEKNKAKIKQRHDQFYQENIDRLRIEDKERYHNRKYQPRYRFIYGKAKAKARNLIFDLSLEEYEILINNNCYYCDYDLKLETGIGLDRIDNSKGYYKDNILPCCGDCNRLRGDRLTVEETKIAVRAILDYRNSK